MKSRPSRFEATLNLACAAMTMLVCGHLTNPLAGERGAPRFVPLREEFADIFESCPRFMKRLGAPCCPEIEGPPYFYQVHNSAIARVRFLLRVRQSPGKIQRALKSPDRLDDPSAFRLSRKLGVDTADVRYCERNRTVDLQSCWTDLRKELIRWRRERNGGAQ